MKREIIIIMTLALSFLTSCTGSKGITPSKDAISGPLGQYFKVVNRTYKIYNGKINVEIERIAEGLPDPWEEGIEVGYSNNNVEPGFVVEFMDASGDIVCKDQSDIVWTKDELVSVVALLVGETSSIHFSVSGKKVSQFKVSSTFKYHQPEESDSYSYGSSAKSSIDEDVSIFEDTFKEVQKEVEDVYREAATEVEDAYNEAVEELKNAVNDAVLDFF